MHPAFREEILRDNRTNLERKLRAASLRHVREPVAASPTEPVTLRLGGAQDDGALGRLAALNDLPTPVGPHLMAEIDGTVIAAMPLGSGPALGDPFRQTGSLISLLETWKKQLAGQRRRSRSQALRIVLR
jgi:hypothetical protein